MDTLQDAPVRPPWLFNAETARLNARKSVELRRQKAERLEALENRPSVTLSDASPIDPLASKLARVQEELVEKMTGNDDPKAVSALAQALKNVRETYHLVTGQAKPGVIRETGRNRRNQDRQQAAPEPEVEEEKAPEPGPDNG